MKVAILGYGKQGQAAYEYWRDGNEITICDEAETAKLPTGARTQLGSNYLHGLGQFDLIVRSPSVHPREIVAANSLSILDKVTTVTNEFMAVCPSKNVIGVTGTKGKGTTSTLITKILEAGGKSVHLGGNIGTPPLDLLKSGIQPDDWVVLELANFQLIDLKQSPHIAVCLMVVPEHLNWHIDMDEYLQAKTQLFAHQSANDIAIYYSENDTSRQIASAGQGRKIPYYAPPGAVVSDGKISIDGQDICQTDELKLLGRHNWQNVCAAVTAVWQITQDIDAIRSVLSSFEGMEHRLELVRDFQGVKFYNDSYSSSLHSTEAAIEAIEGKKVVIVGGFDRLLDLDHFGNFAKAHAGGIRQLLIIGASAERLAGVLDQAGFSNYVVDKQAKTMPAVVAKALALAHPGDAVVLSPGFASFDMFKDFEDRGLQFKAAVSEL